VSDPIVRGGGGLASDPRERRERFALVRLDGPDRGAEALVAGETFRIGKSSDNDLVLSEETVSRAHCELTRDARGYVVRDLGSTNGTWLDGARIREAWLKPGAVLTVGKVELKVRLSAPEPPREAPPSDLPAFDPAKSYRETKAVWDELFEKRYVSWLLEQSRGNISAAARAADMDRKYLHKLLRKHGLRVGKR
jgi:hypothetical protein